MTNSLDLHSQQPLYKQLTGILINEMLASNLQTDDKFLTERAVAEKYNVSTITVRAAMNNLVERNLVYRVTGRGTFVKNIISSNDIMENLGQINNLVFALPKHLGNLTPFPKVLKEE